MNNFVRVIPLISLTVLLLSVSVHAQLEEPRIGMAKPEVMRLFGAHLFTQSTAGDSATFRMQFFGYPANVFVGFEGEKVTFISVSFTSFLTGSDQTNRLTLFRDVRKRLQDLGGNEYAYTRIDNIDVLGESGGWITDKRRRNAFVFGKDHGGFRYHLEIFSESLSDLKITGEVSLTINTEESVQLPTAQTGIGQNGQAAKVDVLPSKPTR
ncbi:MAG: hypothetical protein HYV95_04245 [Opitutae bacterium]|nr:hypothetical protein [Opitutae bacterium]